MNLLRGQLLLGQTSVATMSASTATLPDAPGASSDGLEKSAADSGTKSTLTVDSRFPFINLPAAPVTDKYIEPGEYAPRLTASGKVKIAREYAFSPFDAAGWLLAAGYSQVRNTAPKYGTDSGAFGERLGSHALNDVSDAFLGDALMSNVLHEDPRYYALGPEHNIFVRAVYAGTRPLIARKDDGAITPNFALLSGNLGTAALTNLYYPPANRGGVQTIKTFGWSLGGAALGDVAAEFYGDIVQLLHLHRE